MWKSSFMVLRGLCPGNTVVQQAFKSKGHFSYSSTNSCFPDMFCVAGVIKETPVGKKKKIDLKAHPGCVILEM